MDVDSEVVEDLVIVEDAESGAFDCVCSPVRRGVR